MVAGVFWIGTTVYLMIFEQFPASFGLHIVNLYLGGAILTRGLGFDIDRWIGKKYIRVNTTDITLKLALMKKPLQIKWDALQQLALWPGVIIITTNDQKKHEIQIKEFDPEIRHELLMSLIRFADKNDKKYITHGYLEHVR